MCPSDPLAFQWLAKPLCQSGNVTFVDIDYPALIAAKSEIITSTPQLCEMLGCSVPATPGKDVYIFNERYLAIGCDLSDTKNLEKQLQAVIDLSDCLILCTAEVSMTYMCPEAANGLIAWAAGLNNG